MLHDANVTKIALCIRIYIMYTITYVLMYAK